MKTCATIIRVLNADGIYQEAEVYLCEDGKNVAMDIDHENGEAAALVFRTIEDAKNTLMTMLKFLESSS